MTTQAIGGVEAYVDNFSPWVDPTSASGKGLPQWYNNGNESILLVSSDSNSWVQVGWLEYTANGTTPIRRVYVQQTINGIPNTTFYGSGNPTSDWGSDPANEQSEFKLTYSPTGPNYFAAYWASPQNYGSFSGLTSFTTNFTPVDAQLESETLSDATEFDGGIYNPSLTSGAQMYYPAGPSGQWGTFSGSKKTTYLPSYADLSPNSGASYDIWDTRCDY